IAINNGGDFALRRQNSVFFACYDLRAGIDSLCSRFQDSHGRLRLVSIGSKGKLAIRKGHARTWQSRHSRGRTRRRPKKLLIKLRERWLDVGVSGAGAKDIAEINRSARDVQLCQQVQQRLGWVYLALERNQQLSIRLTYAKGSVHHAHQRNRVRRDFHQLVVPSSQRLLS